MPRSQRTTARKAPDASMPNNAPSQISNAQVVDLPDISNLSAAELLQKAIDLWDNALVQYYLTTLVKKMDNRVDERIEQDLRARSVVISGLPEADPDMLSNERQHDLEGKVDQLLGVLDVECTPDKIYRMDNFDRRRPRLIKVVFPTTFYWKRALANARRLRNSPFHDVFIRRSMTNDERRREFELRQLANERNKGCASREWVVYRGELVRRSSLPRSQEN
ncbi:unnamed protein product [Nippostrongylus brasiliensis]|uniref:Uncharacterized protein n=1 Tax=Nippostrongylus brasiliensis TaxID=27835 RepID=A0A0N4YJ59_NIPBR|nr:unnamed protein product [Nippostrongylus brasiliensis]